MTSPEISFAPGSFVEAETNLALSSPFSIVKVDAIALCASMSLCASGVPFLSPACSTSRLANAERFFAYSALNAVHSA